MSAPASPLELAKLIAKNHGMYIVPVTEGQATAYVLYREHPVKGQRGIRLGRRKNADDLLRLVKTCAGVVEAR
jgi:hypothetical protein